MKKEFFLLILILFGAFFARLYKFERPVADWHSWRQVDTSAVSRNFVKYGFDVLHPKFDDFSKGVSLLDNPKGYRFVEFPIYNLAQAGLYKIFDRLTLEEWGRVVTIFSQVVSMVFLYLIVKRYSGRRVGFMAISFFAFIPYNIYFGRTLLPDSLMVTALLGGIYFFDKWIEEKSKIPTSSRSAELRGASKIQNYSFYFLAVLFTAVAILLKPYALFFTLPMVYLAWRAFSFKFILKWQLWLFLILSIVPFIFWRFWMQQFPEGIPQSGWLFNGTNIRFKGAFFQWLFADRISSLILGYFGLPFVIIGLLAKIKKEGLFFYSFIASSLIYLVVLATGNVQHDYYQILIIPTLAILFAKGMDFVLLGLGNLFNRPVAILVMLVSLLFMFAFSWYRVRDFYNLQHVEVLEAGAAVDRLTEKEAKVIAPYGGDTTLLYYTHRPGWPVFDRPLTEFKKQGADYMIFVNPGSSELNFVKYFEVLDQGQIYIIFNLQKPTPLGEQLLKGIE